MKRKRRKTKMNCGGLAFLVPAIVNILVSLINDASRANDPNYNPTEGILDTIN